jgi:hypothetical protein
MIRIGPHCVPSSVLDARYGYIYPAFVLREPWRYPNARFLCTNEIYEDHDIVFVQVTICDVVLHPSTRINFEFDGL